MNKLEFKNITNQSGVSLIEVLVSLTILAYVGAAFISNTHSMTQLLNKNEIKSQAMYASQKILDEMRLDDPSTYPSTNTSDAAVDVVVDGKTFSVVVTYCSNSSYCPNTSSADTRHILVEVNYQGSEVYEVETVFTKLKV